MTMIYAIIAVYVFFMPLVELVSQSSIYVLGSVEKVGRKHLLLWPFYLVMLATSAWILFLKWLFTPQD